MTVILLPARDLELERQFLAWEKSFLVRPCEVIYHGFPCGHAAAFRAHAKCTGCDAETDTFICSHHIVARDRLAFHGYPCGFLEFKARITAIRPIA